MVLSLVMEGLTTPREQFVELLRSAEATRNAEILRSAQMATDNDRRIEADCSMESLVVRGAIGLAERLSYLVKHPKLPVFLGGCAIKVLKPAEAMGVDCLTQPVLETETEYLGDNSVRSYFQFGVSHYRGSLKGQIKDLEIFGVTEETVSGEYVRTNLFTISADTAEHSYFNRVSGQEIDGHIRQEQKKALAEYKEQNPWVERLMIFKDHGSGWIVIGDDVVRSHDAWEKARRQERRVRHELIPRLNAIEAGPHPDKLYYFPLGLIGQANKLFGTKHQ